MSESLGPSALAPETSPLIEADPNSVNEMIQARIDDIFNKKPALLTDDDLRVQVEYYRRNRERFLKESEEKEKKPPGQRRSSRVPTSVAEAIQSTADLL